MAYQSISKSQLHHINDGSLELLLNGTDSRQDFQAIKFDDLANTLAYVAAVYVDKLAKAENEVHAVSSGQLQDKTIPLDVEILGAVYVVKIQTLDYAKFVDEGVSGWAVDRGSQYRFKTKGVKPSGDLVKSIKAWLMREGSFARVKQKITVNHNEAKRQRITDASTKAAISTAYMIKRQGIKPTNYWRKATNEMEDIIKAEFSAALRVDIINNFGK